MDFKQIQSIIKDFEKSNITSLELEMESLKLKLNKSVDEQVVVKAKPIDTSLPKQQIEEVEEETKGMEVKSPLVGTFYASASPTDEPYVKVGSKVEKGDTLCIIEAMKIMNEITAPVSGVIEKINVVNGDVVSFDEVILTIV